MNTPDRQYWMSNKHHYEHIVSMVLPFPVELHCGDTASSGDGYQFKFHPHIANRAALRFWGWHVEKNPQRFHTPIEAAIAFIQAWRDWAKLQSQSS